MNDTYKNIEDFADEMGIEGLITADGYDEAFVGVADRFGKEPVAVAVTLTSPFHQDNQLCLLYYLL